MLEALIWDAGRLTKATRDLHCGDECPLVGVQAQHGFVADDLGLLRERELLLLRLLLLL